MVPAGLGTALKPAVEDWWLFRAPLSESTVAQQVLATGTGALNIDRSRVAHDGSGVWGNDQDPDRHNSALGYQGGAVGRVSQRHDAGRWPPNLLHDGSPEVLAAFERFGERGGGHWHNERSPNAIYGKTSGGQGERRHDGQGTAARFFPALGYGEDELRFFYSGKASKKDRMGTTHPTTKPVSLISWLAKLVCPPGGTILDPFAGSGTLAVAAKENGFNCILIERESDYIEMIKRRLTLIEGREPQEPTQPEQMSLLDVA